VPKWLIWRFGESRTESVDGYVMSTRNKGHEGLYWFEPLESKMLCPVIGSVVLLVCESQSKDVMVSGRRPRAPYIV
jgi:hypothetical protein